MCGVWGRGGGGEGVGWGVCGFFVFGGDGSF